MAGRRKSSSTRRSQQQNISEGEDTSSLRQNVVGTKTNGRVVSPDYVAPPLYQPPNPPHGNIGHQGSHYQQPYTTGSNMRLEKHDGGPENLKMNHDSEQLDPPYYVQDLAKPRTLSETKQVSDEYRGLVIGGDPPPYRQPHNAMTHREGDFRNEYSGEPPGNLALPSSDYRQQYFSQPMSDGSDVGRRKYPLRLSIGASKWRICSWKICAIVFLALSVCLAATTIYLAASQVSEWQNTPQCRADTSDLLVHSPPSQSHSLPPKQRTSARDSGNLETPWYPKEQSFPPHLFPSMVFKPDGQKMGSKYFVQEQLLSTLDSVLSVMLHDKVSIPVTVTIPVQLSAASIDVSVIENVNLKTHLIFKYSRYYFSKDDLKINEIIPSLNKHKNIWSKPNLVMHKIYKRDASIPSTSILLLKDILFKPTPVQINTNYRSNASQNYLEISKSYIYSNDSKEVILSSSISNNFSSHSPSLNSNDDKEIAHENERIGEEGKKVSIPVENINLYANHSVNSEETRGTPSLSLKSESINTNEIVREQIAKLEPVNTMHNQNSLLHMKAKIVKVSNSFTQPRGKHNPYQLELIPSFLSATPSQLDHFSKESYISNFDSETTKLSITDLDKLVKLKSSTKVVFDFRGKQDPFIHQNKSIVNEINENKEEYSSSSVFTSKNTPNSNEIKDVFPTPAYISSNLYSEYNFKVYRGKVSLTTSMGNVVKTNQIIDGFPLQKDSKKYLKENENLIEHSVYSTILYTKKHDENSANNINKPLISEHDIKLEISSRSSQFVKDDNVAAPITNNASEIVYTKSYSYKHSLIHSNNNIIVTNNSTDNNPPFSFTNRNFNNTKHFSKASEIFTEEINRKNYNVNNILKDIMSENMVKINKRNQKNYLQNTQDISGVLSDVSNSKDELERIVFNQVLKTNAHRISNYFSGTKRPNGTLTVSTTLPFEHLLQNHSANKKYENNSDILSSNVNNNKKPANIANLSHYKSDDNQKYIDLHLYLNTAKDLESNSTKINVAVNKIENFASVITREFNEKHSVENSSSSENIHKTDQITLSPSFNSETSYIDSKYLFSNIASKTKNSFTLSTHVNDSNLINTNSENILLSKRSETTYSAFNKNKFFNVNIVRDNTTHFPTTINNASIGIPTIEKASFEIQKLHAKSNFYNTIEPTTSYSIDPSKNTYSSYEIDKTEYNEKKYPLKSKYKDASKNENVNDINNTNNIINNNDILKVFEVSNSSHSVNIFHTNVDDEDYGIININQTNGNNTSISKKQNIENLHLINKDFINSQSALGNISLGINNTGLRYIKYPNVNKSHSQLDLISNKINQIEISKTENEMKTLQTKIHMHTDNIVENNTKAMGNFKHEQSKNKKNTSFEEDKAAGEREMHLLPTYEIAYDQHSGSETDAISGESNKGTMQVTPGIHSLLREFENDDLIKNYSMILNTMNSSLQFSNSILMNHIHKIDHLLPTVTSKIIFNRTQTTFGDLRDRQNTLKSGESFPTNKTNKTNMTHTTESIDGKLVRILTSPGDEQNENMNYTGSEETKTSNLCACNCTCDKTYSQTNENKLFENQIFKIPKSLERYENLHKNVTKTNSNFKEVRKEAIYEESSTNEKDSMNSYKNIVPDSNSEHNHHKHRHHHGDEQMHKKTLYTHNKNVTEDNSRTQIKIDPNLGASKENTATEYVPTKSCRIYILRNDSRPMLRENLKDLELCSPKQVAATYINLFKTDFRDSPYFYVVPIFYGNEINNKSWHWKSHLSEYIENQPYKLQATSVDKAGSSTMKRPHQIAPPDGASFSVLNLGESLSFLIPPYGYWNLHLTLSDTTEIHLALNVPRGTSLGLYARKNNLPTHTQHDLMKVLRGTTLRETRSNAGSIDIELEEVLEAGDWFLSLYNDDGDPHKVELLVTPGSGSGECPQRCNGRGHCFLGRCQCQTGFSGKDCSEVLCPILCNGRGEYVEGKCRCHPGWKGQECELKHHECEVPDCSGHGRCVDGECHCANGFTGEFCENVDCPNPTCSGHGWCVRGTCVCDRGWRRPDCSQMDTEALQCLPDCSKHGTFDINTHSCICDPPWTGSDCSKESCSLDCGIHGKCENEVCLCDEGWTGGRCNQRLCDRRCAEHGQCKNGTCICMTGWNGRYCTLPGCPGNCMGHGKCLADEEGQWSCECHKEWEGIDCSVRLEMNCDDGIDNDNDGLKDCEDPECCQTMSCTKSQMCVSLPDPIDILLKMQPPAATASFYEKMQFIIQDNSLQSFPGSFNKRRAAVVRGRVVTQAGRPIVGLRVSTDQTDDGMTMTRLDGMFDLMVNGGGAVTLRFGKSPFNPRELRVVVPWNEFVVLDDIAMTVEQRHGNYHQPLESVDHFGFNSTLGSKPCPQHDYDTLRPVIMSTWQNEFQGECPDVDAILVETQAVQESVQIPGTGLYLVYHSSRATGYKSTLRFQLTPEVIPSTLRRVHLRIVLEGILYKKVFEADPLIKFTYSWDRNNVYKLKVYGTTVARISVGYEHTGCQNMILWDHHTTKVAGYDLAISQMGGFNLHVHHAYNFHQGILQKGDGRNIHLTGQRHLVTTLLGTGEQREVVCGSQCEGEAIKNPLLAPTSLAAGPDGSLFVGDFNLIRRVTPDGKVFTIAKLNETRVSYRYHLAVSPITGKVYVSDPDAHQVLEIQKTSDVKDPSRNVIPLVGSGQRCLPGDRNKCGDGGPAIHARLTYPKGLAISSDDELYIADGTNIRIVKDKVIRTVIGGHEHRSHWAPVPCNGTIEKDQLRLRWPTELAISPLDGSLHILDDHLILRLTPDNRVQVVTGRPLHCPAPFHNSQHTSKAALLLAPQSISFSLQGDLYIAESDTQRINRVRVITTSGHISTFAGADSKCNCRDRSCFCHTFDNVSATSAVFSLISAIAVTPDGILHISDQAGYRVRSVRSILPQQNEYGEYEIFSPDTHEVYIFNRFGKHMVTRNLVTGQTIYKFNYNTNANTGKLSSVTDAASNSFKVIRRTYAKKTFIENPQKQRVTIHFTVMNNDLEKLESPDGYNISFRYHGASGLIQSKMEGGGSTYSYEYDEQGRLVRAVLPTGEVIALNFDLSTNGARVLATRDGEKSVTAVIRGNTIHHKTDSVQIVSEPRGEGGLRLLTSWDHEISLERSSYRVLETRSPTSAQMFPILSQQQTHIGKELVNRYHWTYFPAEHIYRHDGIKVSADLKVNGEGLLTLGYDPVSSSEAILSVSGEVLVNITYDKIGRPTVWKPMKPLLATTVNYDEWGHVTLWKRGDLSEEYKYDNFLRLASVTYADNTTVRYDFRDQLTKPERVTYPSGRSYGLVYDEAGALREVITPKGSIYSLHLSTSLGFYRLRLALPNDVVVMQMRIDEQGRLTAVAHPNKEGIVLYEYDLLGRLRNELYGHGLTAYQYLDSGLLKSARTRHDNHDIRIDYRYRTGLAKEMKIRYGPKSHLHTVKFHYQYDESARLRIVEGEVNSKPIHELYLKYNNLTGTLLSVSDLRFIRNNILETIIQNQKKFFVDTRVLDNYGRLTKEVISLQGRTVYMMNLKYDLRGRILEQVNEISGRRILTSYKYMTDGQILEANGGHTRLYTYDKNGNILSFTEESRAEFLHYDECDRVIKAGDGDVDYDFNGYVIRFDDQTFEYNTKGQLIAGFSRQKSWSFIFKYDHLSRVSVYRDHNGNVTQIIYGRPDKPYLISHLHYPRLHSTYTFIYDDRDKLIAIDNADGRMFVATDQIGAPIAFFDENGSLIRRQRWTPFGKLADSAGIPMWIGVGPWGGLLEPLTGIIILKGYAYHPMLLQWMTPRWDKLTRATRQVTDVFVYRFRNNDPVNHPEQLDYHFNDVSDWLGIMGIDLKKILGSEYQEYMLERPKASIDVSAVADSEVVSGLWCQYRSSVDHLLDLSFFSRSHIQRHVGEWKGAPISRQSYVFGPGVLVSNVQGRALVTYVPMIKDGSSVIGNVIRTVLNNSLILDVASTEDGKDTFFFIKEEKRRASEDRETLARLSGIYNITHSESHDGLENRVSTPTANIIIFYNRQREKTRNRILAELEIRAEEAAWAREVALAVAGRSGTRPWQPSEVQELVTKGRVRGYITRHVHSSNKYPLLAADPSNILFKHERSRKRRKSHKKDRQKGWRRRNKNNKSRNNEINT